MAADLRPGVARGNGVLPAAPVQPVVRRAPGRLVRPEPSGRRFCRDFCRLVDAGRDLARTLPRLESAPETRVHRCPDEVARRPTARPPARYSTARLRLPQRQA